MYHYRECGLSNIWLANGYRWVATPYGKGLSLQDPDGLQRAIAKAVAAKPGKLTGAEFRFLRKAMNLSQRALARMLGNEEQTVAIWEKRRGAPLWADRVIRALSRENLEGRARLKEIFTGTRGSGNGKTRPVRAGPYTFERRRAVWREASAGLARAA